MRWGRAEGICLRDMVRVETGAFEVDGLRADGFSIEGVSTETMLAKSVCVSTITIVDNFRSIRKV